MSDADWLWLDDDEAIQWEGRPRLTTIATSVAVGVFIVVVAAGLALVIDPRLAAVGVLGVPIPLVGYLSVTNTTYLVTTQAVWCKTGIRGRSVRRIARSRIQNTAYRQSVRGSLFGYGTVRLEVAGGRDLQFRRIADPQTVQELITDYRRRENHTDVAGSLDQWQAVLAAVKDIRSVVNRRTD